VSVTKPSDYYQKTAAQYDRWHVQAGDQHSVALNYLSHLLQAIGACSMLDVGTGTGRVIRYISECLPGMKVVGIEPAAELREIALKEHGLPKDSVLPGDGLDIPFPDQSFDVVCEFAVLHHVQKPEKVVSEMLRVARKAVVLSDENRFAYGPFLERLAKVALCKIGLFPAFYWLKTRGKGYRYSEEDGVAYSYSVFDALPQFSRWADRTIMIPLDRTPLKLGYENNASTLFQPLLTSFHLMMMAVRDVSPIAPDEGKSTKM
jgi:ubiquinone/menaquinone biosynthesis C-methylase UbiE